MYVYELLMVVAGKMCDNTVVHHMEWYTVKLFWSYTSWQPDSSCLYDLHVNIDNHIFLITAPCLPLWMAILSVSLTSITIESDEGSPFWDACPTVKQREILIVMDRNWFIFLYKLVQISKDTWLWTSWHTWLYSSSSCLCGVQSPKCPSICFQP